MNLLKRKSVYSVPGYINFVPTKGIKTLSPETFPGVKISTKCVCGRVPPRTQLGELTAIPRSCWIRGGEGKEEEGRGGKGGGGERSGKRGRQRRGREGREGKNPKLKV